MEALLEACVRLAIPLLLAALGELVIERAGMINIGVEGTMLVGAFIGFAVGLEVGSPLLGMAAAALAGASVGMVFGFFTLVRRADQIVVGTAINLLALGSTGLAARALWKGAVPTGQTLPVWSIPGLSELPWVGPAFFSQGPHAYLAFAIAPMVAWWLVRTRHGLQLRAVGEDARAADAEGVSVFATRAWALLFGAGLMGIAGSTLSLSLSNTFTEGMTAGRGFIALTVVIFARWSPVGAVAAALFFGSATAAQNRLQAMGTAVPYQLTLMLPYVLTLVVLALAARRSTGPSDLGQPFSREAG
jgi:ABC-type uncharacterized transport system permease subunit